MARFLVSVYVRAANESEARLQVTPDYIMENVSDDWGVPIRNIHERSIRSGGYGLEAKICSSPFLDAVDVTDSSSVGPTAEIRHFGEVTLFAIPHNSRKTIFNSRNYC
jgi:hypothetical protein